MKALIIEDDPEIVESISLALQIRWPETHIVSTHLGKKGVDLAESEAPDIIILDLGLPDISGFDVLKQVRSFSSAPIIILTVKGHKCLAERKSQPQSAQSLSGNLHAVIRFKQMLALFLSYTRAVILDLHHQTSILLPRSQSNPSPFRGEV